MIGQAEIFPALVARHTWKGRLAGKRVVWFIDNESARAALVKQYSPVVASLNILVQCTAMDAQTGLESWYARVPTASNPADAPSRLQDEGLMARGSARVSALFPDGSFHDDLM